MRRETPLTCHRHVDMPMRCLHTRMPMREISPSCSLRSHYYCFSPSVLVFRSVSLYRRRPQAVKNFSRTSEDTKCHHQGGHGLRRRCIHLMLMKILAANTLNCKYQTMKHCRSSQVMVPRSLSFVACPHLRGQQVPVRLLVCSSTRTIPAVNHPLLILPSAN